jgi:hypothetical protein
MNPSHKLWQGIEQRRAQVEQVQENSSREGHAYATYEGTFLGDLKVPTVFNFGTAFQEMPIFTFGSSLVEDVGNLPLCIAGVYRWRQDANGYYTGAYCHFYIGNLSSSDSPSNVLFHLMWSGIKVKNFIASPTFDAGALDI